MRRRPHLLQINNPCNNRIAKVDTREELISYFKSLVDDYGLEPEDYPIVQQGVPGDDYCVTTLFDQGKLVACMTYRNIRQFPADKGAGVVRETVKAKKMESVCEALLGTKGWHGVAEIDFRWTGEPAVDPWLIEVNPRFWGGLTQAVESGWDYPWLLYRLAVDGKVDSPKDVSYDVKTEAPLVGLLATLQEISKSSIHSDNLKEAWNGARQEFKEGSKREGLRQLLSGLRDYVDIKGRTEKGRTSSRSTKTQSTTCSHPMILRRFSVLSIPWSSSSNTVRSTWSC